jgi:hypothetical protein
MGQYFNVGEKPVLVQDGVFSPDMQYASNLLKANDLEIDNNKAALEAARVKYNLTGLDEVDSERMGAMANDLNNEISNFIDGYAASGYDPSKFDIKGLEALKEKHNQLLNSNDDVKQVKASYDGFNNWYEKGKEMVKAKTLNPEQLEAYANAIRNNYTRNGSALGKDGIMQNLETISLAENFDITKALDESLKQVKSDDIETTRMGRAGHNYLSETTNKNNNPAQFLQKLKNAADAVLSREEVLKMNARDLMFYNMTQGQAGESEDDIKKRIQRLANERISAYHYVKNENSYKISPDTVSMQAEARRDAQNEKIVANLSVADIVNASPALIEQNKKILLTETINHFSSLKDDKHTPAEVAEIMRKALSDSSKATGDGTRYWIMKKAHQDVSTKYFAMWAEMDKKERENNPNILTMANSAARKVRLYDASVAQTSMIDSYKSAVLGPNRQLTPADYEAVKIMKNDMSAGDFLKNIGGQESKKFLSIMGQHIPVNDFVTNFSQNTKLVKEAEKLILTKLTLKRGETKEQMSQRANTLAIKNLNEAFLSLAQQKNNKNTCNSVIFAAANQVQANFTLVGDKAFENATSIDDETDIIKASAKKGDKKGSKTESSVVISFVAFGVNPKSVTATNNNEQTIKIH